MTSQRVLYNDVTIRKIVFTKWVKMCNVQKAVGQDLYDSVNDSVYRCRMVFSATGIQNVFLLDILSIFLQQPYAQLEQLPVIF